MVDVLEFIKREPVMFTVNVYEDIAINAAPRKYPKRTDFTKLLVIMEASIEIWRFQSAINFVYNNFEPYLTPRFELWDHKTECIPKWRGPKKVKSKKINRKGALIMFEKLYGKDTNKYEK